MNKCLPSTNSCFTHCIFKLFKKMTAMSKKCMNSLQFGTVNLSLFCGLLAIIDT